MSILLPVHIAGATAALVAGTGALVARKGSGVHRAMGRVFVYAMLTMCVSAVAIATAKGQVVNAIAGTLTAYLVITALTTVTRQPYRSRAFDGGLMILAFALGLTTLTFGVKALTSAAGTMYGYPAFPFFIFAAVGLLGGTGDLRIARHGHPVGAPRLVRHLWRMCWALWIATVSFFSVRSRVAVLVPSDLVTPAVQATPVLAVTVVMLYWLWRVRVRPQYLRPRQSAY